MPIIKSAKKKMIQDRKRTKHNESLKSSLKKLIKDTRRGATEKNLQAVFSALDKAVKTKLIHANKAARLKSRLSKGTSGSGVSKITAKKKPVAKKSVKKSVKKTSGK